MDALRARFFEVNDSFLVDAFSFAVNQDIAKMCIDCRIVLQEILEQEASVLQILGYGG